MLLCGEGECGEEAGYKQDYSVFAKPAQNRHWHRFAGEPDQAGGMLPEILRSLCLTAISRNQCH
jgi:hypothetical protein